MPSIEIKTNVTVSETAAQTVKSRLGQMISCFPGKSESALMIVLDDGKTMWFRGKSDKPMALMSVHVFGQKVDPVAANQMTKEACDLFQQELGIAPEEVYIRYQAISNWGWNGGNF